MIKKYNILKADPAGEVWSAHGHDLQSFFLTIEGIEATVMVNRKAGNSLLVGPTWGELEELLSKKGKPYFKFKPSPAPDNPTASQTSPGATGAQEHVNVEREPITWGEAVIAASMLASREDGIPAILSWANDLYHSLPNASTSQIEDMEAEVFKPKEEVSQESDNQQIDLSEIPF